LSPTNAILWHKRAEYNINEIDDTVFDDPFCFCDRELFFKTHPSVDENLYWEVRNLANFYTNTLPKGFHMNQMIVGNANILRKEWNANAEKYN